MLTEKENIQKIKENTQSIIQQSSKANYVIIDGDRTLISTDSTKYFFRYLDLDFYNIKSIFKKHGYSFEGFRDVALFYSKIQMDSYHKACDYSAKSVIPYPEFISFIKESRQYAEVILITSGLARIWKNFLENQNLDSIHLLGGNFFPEDEYVVDKNAKGIAIDELRKYGKNSFAFGDSLVDFEMLKKADHPFLVVNEKLNRDILPLRDEIPLLQQISFNGYEHNGIPVANLKSISELIADGYARNSNI